MNAIEFQTTIREDGSIVVPQEYTNNIGTSVRVILLSSERLKTNNTTKPKFSAVSIKTNGFEFNREYANER